RAYSLRVKDGPKGQKTQQRTTVHRAPPRIETSLSRVYLNPQRCACSGNGASTSSCRSLGCTITSVVRFSPSANQRSVVFLPCVQRTKPLGVTSPASG